MNNKIFNIILSLLLMFSILFVNIAPTFAAFMDDDDTTTKKERQLLKKIEIIHETFPNQTDEAALYATLVHRGTFTDYVNDSYDPDWDENESEFESGWQALGKDFNDIFDNPFGIINWNNLLAIFNGLAAVINGTITCLFEGNLSQSCVLETVVNARVGNPNHTMEQTVEKQYSQDGIQSIDLLTAATIVMLDSSGWTGSYSDENYQKALAGDGLVGNLVGSDGNYMLKFVATVYNGVFCAAGAAADIFTGGAAVDIATTGFNITAPITNSIEFGSSAFLSTPSQRMSRYYTMARICENGFIGGTYQSVQDIKDEKIYQGKKDKIAEEIIGLAQKFRELENKTGGDLCLTGITQAASLMDLSVEELLDFLGSIAQVDYSRTGVFASVTLGQLILESGMKFSQLALQNNNLFGIKCGDWPADKCSNWGTLEDSGGGNYYGINDAFRIYDSVEESFADHSSVVLQYSNVATSTSPREQIQAIKNGGYATDSAYVSKVMSIIDTYDLTKWDVKTNSTSSTNVCSPVGLSGWNIRTIAPSASDSAFNYVSSNRGQCVWYAQGRAIEIVEELGKNGKLSTEEVEHIRELLLVPPGNGGEIYDNAVARGNFNTSNDIKQPKAGAFIVWKEPGNYGHVAVVEDVNTTDNTITITEGWASSGSSCPSDWSCVQFQNTTMDLDEFYNGYGKSYTGGYQFSGYVYFLEPLQ